MIDCHIHILPAIDDGANSFDEALKMARQSYQSGVDQMIVTPHSNQFQRYENYYDKTLLKVFHDFKETLKTNDIPLQIYLGMEIFASDDLVEKIENGQLIGLNSTRYYLVEFAFNEEIDYIEKILMQLLDHHMIPIIAHPERYTCFQKEPWLIYRFLKAGCLSQINKDSVFGFFGKSAMHTAKMLLDYHLVSLVASDGHSSFWRDGAMDEIQTYLEYHYGLRYAKALLYDHPQAILKNKVIIFHSDENQ